MAIRQTVTSWDDVITFGKYSKVGRPVTYGELKDRNYKYLTWLVCQPAIAISLDLFMELIQHEPISTKEVLISNWVLNRKHHHLTHHV